jgi:hypothetical protein
MPRQLRNFLLRLLVAAVVLLGLGCTCEAPLVTPLLPALAWLIEASGDRFRVDRIEVVDRAANKVIALKVTPVRPLSFGGRLMLPDDQLFFEPSTLVGSVLQPLLAFLAILLAWPVSGSRALAQRLLIAGPVAALLFATNVPLGLVGAMLDFRPIWPAAPVHPLVYWNDFLQTGGALSLAIAAALLVAGRRRPDPANDGHERADRQGSCATGGVDSLMK